MSRRLKNFLLKNFFDLGLWDWHRCRDHLFKRSSQPIKLQRWKQVTSTACLCCCGLYFQGPAFIDIKRSLHSLLKSFLFLTEITGTDCVEEGKRLIPRTLSRILFGSLSFSCTFSAIFSLTVLNVTDSPSLLFKQISYYHFLVFAPGTFGSFTLLYGGNAWAFIFPTHDLAQVFGSQDGGFRFFLQSIISSSSGNILDH